MKTTICAGTLVTYNFFYPYLDEYTEQDFKYATHWCDIHPSLSDSYIINNISALALKSNDLRFKEIIRLIRNDHSMTISNKLYKTNNNLSFFNILYSYFKFHTTKK